MTGPRPPRASPHALHLMLAPLRPAIRQRLTAWLLAALACAALLAVFLAYLAPETVVDLSNRFWSCF